MRKLFFTLMALFLCNFCLSGEKADSDSFTYWEEQITKILAEPHEPSPTLKLNLHKDWADYLIWLEKLYTAKAEASRQLREALLKNPDAPITQSELSTLSLLIPRSAISYPPPTPTYKADVVSRQMEDFQRQVINSINRLETRLSRLESDISEIRRRVISIDTKYR